MRLLINATFALTLSSANVASAQPSRLACDSFAQIAVTVVQIRQQEPKANRVFEYADANLRDEYPPHVFELVKKMIGDAFARQPVSPTALDNEARTFAREQRSECNRLYAQLGD